MSEFCVYVTIYMGEKLPPFYIGSSSVERIKRGYRGSVSSKKYKSIWKREMKDNASLFETKIIRKFKSRKDALLYEQKLHLKLNVVTNPMFINQSTAIPMGIFGKECGGQLNGMYGKFHSTYTKTLISKKATGRKCAQTTIEKMRKLRADWRENCWQQIRKKSDYQRFSTFDEFEQEALSLYEASGRNPSIIAENMKVSMGSVRTILSKNNLEFDVNQTWTKIIKKYSLRWTSLKEYEDEIIKHHNMGLSPCQISSVMGIGGWGVSSTLRKHNITPHQGKKGPKTKFA